MSLTLNNTTAHRVIAHTLDNLDKVCYNTFLTHTKQTMQNTKSKLDSLMLQLQAVLDDAGLDEHETIQNAFNALACALDEEIIA